MSASFSARVSLQRAVPIKASNRTLLESVCLSRVLIPISDPSPACGVCTHLLSLKIPEENLSQALEVVQKHFLGVEIDMSEVGSLPAQTRCNVCDSATQRRYPIVLPPGDLYLASVKRGTPSLHSLPFFL